MSTQNTHSSNILLEKKQSKDKGFTGQMRTVYKSFSERPKTMLMVSVETGILRANICRYISEWEKENRICIVRKELCPITKHRAGFYYTGKEVQNGK